MRVAFATLGCKVNQYETDAMRELFRKAGHEEAGFDEKADVYIVNTCTVTATGDKKSRQTVSRAHAANPDGKVIVAGCYAQASPEEAISLPGVVAIMGTAERNDIVRIAEEALGGKEKREVKPHGRREGFEELTVSTEGRTRAFLKIQDGCDRFCSYCIIPYARGAIRSRTVADVRRQLELLNDAGYKEVVLTGIHLMSYGRDLENASLLDAVNAAEGLDNIKRVRLGSLEPPMLTDEMIAALAENPKIARQFHLSLQSGSATVLKRMARRYTPEDYLSRVEAIRRYMPEAAITTDIIAGFPGETEAEFLETLAFAKEARLARIHVFPYSRRKGTRAYDMAEQVPTDIKKRRARELIRLASELEAEYLSGIVGTRQSVLMEERQGDYIQGRTGTYALVCAKAADDSLLGEIVDVDVTRASKGTLFGDII